jgi:hypothetical protein
MPPFSKFVGAGLSALDILDMIPSFEFKYPFDVTLKNAVFGSLPCQYSSVEQMGKYMLLFPGLKETSIGSVTVNKTESIVFFPRDSSRGDGEINQEEGIKKDDITTAVISEPSSPSIKGIATLNTPPHSPASSNQNIVFPFNVSIHYTINQKQGDKESSGFSC